jgi:hypothetical protein
MIVYHGVVPSGLQAANLLIRVRGGDATSVIPRIQQIIANGNPDFRLGRISSLSPTPNPRYLSVVRTGGVLAVLTVVLLSAVGIHALMSVTVTRRRKEIGIRIALGASRGRLLASIFSRAAWQLALGGSVGALLGALLLRFTVDGGLQNVSAIGWRRRVDAGGRAARDRAACASRRRNSPDGGVAGGSRLSTTRPTLTRTANRQPISSQVWAGGDIMIRGKLLIYK